jgi:glycosyltransferase involved in cell wall biosynthesis
MTEELIKAAKTEFDLTDPSHQESVLQLAERFLDFLKDGDIDVLRKQLRGEGVPMEARMAGLLACSKKWMLQNQQPKKVAVVFAMWGEQNRLLPKSENNPNGEDSLVAKLEQLDWAARESTIDWHLYAVDDGCPHGSGAIAKRVASEHLLGDKVSILSLNEALPADNGPLANLASADDSRKAGAIIMGAIAAIDDGADAVIYTDADNSVHLGQIGLLLQPYVDTQIPVVLGDRKHADSVLVKEGARWGIGIKVLRHMQRMIGHAVFSRGILDTQAAFKLYDSQLLKEMIAEPTVYDFSFDTDWILAALKRGVQIEQVAFAFIDSAAESASITQGPMTTWETLLFGLEKQVRKYGFAEGDAAAMGAVLRQEIKDYRDLEKIIDHLPAELEQAGEKDYGDPAVMSPDALREWLRDRIVSSA